MRGCTAVIHLTTYPCSTFPPGLRIAPMGSFAPGFHLRHNGQKFEGKEEAKTGNFLFLAHSLLYHSLCHSQGLSFSA